MKSLTNQQSEQLNFFKSELRQKQENIESVIADFNTNVEKLWADLVAGSIDEYNLTVIAAQDFIDQTREEIQTYYDLRKLSWQSKDHGTSLRAFLDQWDTILEDIDLDSPRETYVPSYRAVRKLDSLPVDPD